MSHSTSNKKHAISSFNPQGTSKPGISRMGGAINISLGNKIGVNTKQHECETTGFGRAMHEEKHRGGTMGDA
jgi:hypothetical protein